MITSETAIEKLALGAALCKKLKANYIDNVGDLTESIRTGQIRFILNPKAMKNVRQVLMVAGIAIPEKAAPAEKEESRC